MQKLFKLVINGDNLERKDDNFIELPPLESSSKNCKGRV
jgi:hypothetical protein